MPPRPPSLPTVPAPAFASASSAEILKTEGRPSEIGFPRVSSFWVLSVDIRNRAYWPPGAGTIGATKVSSDLLDTEDANGPTGMRAETRLSRNVGEALGPTETKRRKPSTEFRVRCNIQHTTCNETTRCKPNTGSRIIRVADDFDGPQPELQFPPRDGEGAL